MNAAQPAIVYRPGSRRDLTQIMAVMQRAFDPAFGEAWTRAQVEGMLDIPGSWLSVAVTDGQVIAFSLMRSILDEAELLLIAVDPAWQGRSIGRALLLDNISTATSHNIRHIHLEVRATNKAIELYRSAGFVHSNTRKSYYRGQDGQMFDAYSFIIDLEVQDKST
jgi:ribosomal-protein-alanine N-acetyltransferase